MKLYKQICDEYEENLYILSKEEDYFYWKVLEGEWPSFDGFVPVSDNFDLNDDRTIQYYVEGNFGTYKDITDQLLAYVEIAGFLTGKEINSIILDISEEHDLNDEVESLQQKEKYKMESQYKVGDIIYITVTKQYGVVTAICPDWGDGDCLRVRHVGVVPVSDLRIATQEEIQSLNNGTLNWR